VLARVPVTRMSLVAVRALSQDNRVETQSQVSDRRDTSLCGAVEKANEDEVIVKWDEKAGVRLHNHHQEV
jgi:hypothetical protein